MRAFITHVRHIVEYNSVIWSPYTVAYVILKLWSKYNAVLLNVYLVSETLLRTTV